MSTPAGQVLQTRDLKRMHNLMDEQQTINFDQKDRKQLEQMTEEVLQFKQFIKLKIKAEMKRLQTKQTTSVDLSAANDELHSPKYSQRTTFLVD